MFALFRKYASAISSVTLWGLADDNTWLDTYPVSRKDAPLLFDTTLQAKSAYWGVVDPTKIGTTTTAATTAATTSPTVAPTTSGTGNPTDWPSPSQSSGANSCAVTYKVTGSWQGGFQGDVKITNTGTASTSSWRLNWQFTAGQTITQLWNGSVTQNESAVAVFNATWNGVVPPGGSASFGFLGSWTGSNPAPTGFSMNGIACGVA
jgi:endo-1,4-beta-xylanase